DDHVYAFLKRENAVNPSYYEDGEADHIVALYTFYRSLQTLNPEKPHLKGTLFNKILPPISLVQQRAARSKLAESSYWQKFKTYFEISPNSVLAAFLESLNELGGDKYKKHLKEGFKAAGLIFS